MPRDGAQNYSPPFPDVAPDTTIASTVYNGFVHDVAQDLNTPRPVVAGGTGANNSVDAMNNLGGELSKAAVTNYDIHPFQAGSFYSAAGATSAPVDGHAFAGICYVAVVSGVATSDMFIEASDRDDAGRPGAKWVRQKKAGVWSNWQRAVGVASGGTPPTGAPDNSLWWDPTRGKLFVRYNDGNSVQWVEAVAVPDIDPNTFVEITGDSMTGMLVLPATAPTLATHATNKAYVDLKADLNSPVFTGNPQAPNPPGGDNDASIATTQFVTSAVATSIKSVKRQVFLASGTYTPSAGMAFCMIECIGAGAGGGGVGASTGGCCSAGGGGSGGYSRLLATAVTIGASKAVTIGAQGSGGPAGNNNGSSGGATSVGTLCVANGGSFGSFAQPGAAAGIGGAGATTTGGVGDVVFGGSPGAAGTYATITTIATVGGNGGSGPFGGGGGSTGVNAAGSHAYAYGSGGGGGAGFNGGTAFAGGNGSAGVVFITEYCTQ